MAFTKAQSVSTDTDTSGTSLATTTLSSITAGQLIAVWIKHEGAPTTLSVTGGGNTFTPLTKTDHANGDMSCQWFYCLAAASGSYQLTANFTAAKVFRTIQVWVYNYTGTASFDTGTDVGGTGTNSGAIATSAFSTTGTDEVVLIGYGEYSAADITLNPVDINGVAADTTQKCVNGHNFTVSWDRILTATFTSGTGSADVGGSSAAWSLRAAGFKATAGGGPTAAQEIPAILQALSGGVIIGRVDA